MKKRVTATLDVDVMNRARLAVREGAAPSLAGLIEHGLRLAVRAIERQRGRRFKGRAVRLKAGRKQRRTKR